jgi:hypothetical protein
MPTAASTASTITTANRPTLTPTDRPTLQAASNKFTVVSTNTSTVTPTTMPTAASANSSNVLALHRAKAGNSQKTLTPQQLATCAQALNQNQPVTLSHNTPQSEPSSSESWTPNQIKSKKNHQLKRRPSQFQSPSRLGYYSPRSKSILKEAKMKYRIYIATQVAFPTTAQALEQAVSKYNLSGDEYAAETESERDEIPLFDTGRLQVVSFQVYAPVCVIF